MLSTGVRAAGRTPAATLLTTQAAAVSPLAVPTLTNYQPARTFKTKKYHDVTLIPGDGIGPEITNAVKTVFEAANVPVRWDVVEISNSTLGEDDEADLEDAPVVQSLRKNRVGLKGTTLTKAISGPVSTNVALRQTLDLFANVVHCKSLPGVKTRFKDIDIVVIRENTEGEYSGLEHSPIPGVVESLKVVTYDHSHRIAEYAFQYAQDNDRKKVTAVHKANIMKLGDGLFLAACREIAALYPNIEYEEMIVDNTCMQMVANPRQFDVMVMPNLYGNIVSHIGIGLIGGLGLVSGVNTNGRVTLFEQGARHAAMDIMGKNIANPIGMITSGVHLLNHIGLNETAARVRRALHRTIETHAVLTPDMGGTATTTDVVDAVCRWLE